MLKQSFPHSGEFGRGLGTAGFIDLGQQETHSGNLLSCNSLIVPSVKSGVFSQQNAGVLVVKISAGIFTQRLTFGLALLSAKKHTNS